MPRSVCISDANIWIDLANAGLLASVFQLPFTYCSTDFVVDDELHKPLRSQLMTLGLVVRALSDTEVVQLIELAATHRNSSLPDVSCYFVARADDHNLLTGDRQLRTQAAADGIEVHGVLWLLDELLVHLVITPPDAAAALQAMLDRGARLPPDECARRFAEWRGSQRD